MIDIKNKWASLPPAKQRILAVSCIVAAVLAVIAVLQTEPEKEEKYVAKRDQVSSVFTNTNTRNQTLDHLAGQLKNLRRMNEQILHRLDMLENRDISRDLSRLSQSIDEKLVRQQEAMREMEARVKEDTRSVVEDQVNNAAMVAGNAAVEGGGAPNPIAEKNATRHTRKDGVRTAQDQGASNGLTPAASTMPASGNVFDVTPPTKDDKGPKREAKPLKLSVMSEAIEEEKNPSGKKKPAKDSEAYIPAGSILTGTILTGGEFPTNKGAFDNPTPILIRLSKEAILPNRYRSDVRECFLIAGGAGDLASERAKVRGETLSCVRHDGSVIETKLESYVAGEDGKAGIKGRLVSKQGQIIARSLVAGFAGGMSEAFDVDPVPVLATSTTGETQYQDALSTNAVQGAAVKGISQSLDRVAQFYLDMAEDVFPVVEINAGRQVDIIVISGTTLKISAKGSLAKN